MLSSSPLSASGKAPTATPARALERLFNWRPETQAPWKRFTVAVLLTVLALWLRMALAPADSGGRFLTMSLAAALAALYGGFMAGMLSTALGMLLVNFFLVKPYFSMAIEDPVEAFWLNFFHLITQLVVVGVIWLMQQKHRHLQDAIESARNSQRHFLDTFEHAAASISHVALDGRLLRANATLCRMVGYTAEELLTKRFQDFTHPDDIGPDERFLQQARDGKRNSFSVEKRYIHKSGRIVWAHLTVALMRERSGMPAYFITVAQDITNFKQTDTNLRTNERLMRQAQALAGFISWQAEMETDRLRAIGGSFQSLGLHGNEVTGAELAGAVYVKDRERLRNDWRDALKGLRPFNAIYRARIQGADRWFSVRAEFERDAAGRAVRAFGVAQDITDRKRTEHEVRRLNASLEQRIQDRTRELKDAYDELESYSYAVAHDLRSPLRIINGFAQALIEDQAQLNQQGRSHLQRIMGASKKMGELIDGLLQLSQIGRGDLDRQPVDLSAIATRLLEELTQESPGRRVRWSVAPDLHGVADPSLIEALMQNLLHNAWKYTATTPDAQIRVYSRWHEGEMHYCVSDNGAGFDMSRAEKLFKPFSRLHQPHEFAGLGIGLATVQRIVLRHGGSLAAQAAPGEGATFCFTLPQAEALDSVPYA